MSLRLLITMLAAASVFATIAMASSDGIKSYKGWRSDESKQERTQPIGQVYKEGDSIPNPAPVVAAVAAGPRTGEQIFNSNCQACHLTGAAGAPKRGDKAAWAPRLGKGEAALLVSLTGGTAKGMPPKGMCMDCSDEELKTALSFMLAPVK